MVNLVTIDVVHQVLGQRPHGLLVTQNAEWADTCAQVAFVAGRHVLEAALVVSLAFESAAEAFFVFRYGLRGAGLLTTTAASTELFDIIQSKAIRQK